jgi:hypothetical protein
MAVAPEWGVQKFERDITEAVPINPSAAHHDDKAYLDESIYRTNYSLKIGFQYYYLIYNDFYEVTSLRTFLQQILWMYSLFTACVVCVCVCVFIHSSDAILLDSVIQLAIPYDYELWT